MPRGIFFPILTFLFIQKNQAARGCEVVESVVEDKVSLLILDALREKPEVTFPGKEDASQASF